MFEENSPTGVLYWISVYLLLALIAVLAIDALNWCP